MAPRSKLKIALAAEKGLTDKKVKQIKDKKKHKAVIKEKRKKGLLPDEEEEEDWEDDDDSEADDGEGLLDIAAEESDEDEDDDESVYEEASAAAILNESDTDSESEVDMEEKIERKPKSILKKTENRRKQRLAEANENDDDDDDDDDAEEESDIALSDLEDLPEEEREDLFVKTKLSINNQPALLAAVKRISIPKDSSTSFATHQTVVSSEPTESKIEDISDDLQRELQLRALLKAEGLPFSRPKDYFAEMVKDDGHMEKVKAKLIEEATAKKASAEARKLRDLKKFGKQVQVAKLQERQKEKRETLEKIKALKKKRAENGGDIGTNEADLFDVGVDNELNKPGKRGRLDQGSRTPNHKRAKKDAKFGFGGKKRYSKSGDAESSGDVSGFSAKGMKGKGGPKKIAKTARLGKSKRKTVAGRR
ncbi:hypothetical protein INS49_005133 [Diaporthe citri]|uniref:uncharacterized protein n=1 Tax=Diaporthe citri TaxID=83186 RepID=UPI001C816305|nr:uncharacterized protein INS49_005133 [Diaporthe citri]KAG6353876.1 hypothetical protein INS49_005133 [Diaporthe citri]